MSQNTRLAQPDANEIPAEISELVAAIHCLPSEVQARIEPSLAKVVESTKRRRRILTLVQDALSQLRVDMKYLVFDLEATRRERDEFRRQLNEANGQ
ncbi:MAG: transcriptional regulator [Pirellulales bacterium]|nr:transcriptional regulator [Pirellulales bacterium]